MRLLDFDAGELALRLQKYLDTDTTYRRVFEYTKQQFEAATQLAAHNWDHAYRDTLNAVVVGEAEGADMRIVLPAITMHDIGFLYGATGQTHGSVGADKLSEYLRAGGIEYSDEDISFIADCIRTHKGSVHNEKPQSLEAKVVADADLLEKFGPFGVYQTIRTFAEFNWPLDRLVSRRDQIINFALETAAGKSLAEPGRQFVVNFYNELAEAISPYEPAKEIKQE